MMITFCLYIFLSLPASASIGGSIFLSSSHIAPLCGCSFVELEMVSMSSDQLAAVSYKLQGKNYLSLIVFVFPLLYIETAQ